MEFNRLCILLLLLTSCILFTTCVDDQAIPSDSASGPTQSPNSNVDIKINGATDQSNGSSTGNTNTNADGISTIGVYGTTNVDTPDLPNSTTTGTVDGQATITVPGLDTGVPNIYPSAHEFGQLFPILECITNDEENDEMIAYFGFYNGNSEIVSVPLGIDNQFFPSPLDRSQSTDFVVGRSYPFPNAAFNVTTRSSATYVWRLNGYEVSVNSNDQKCFTDSLSFYIEYEKKPLIHGDEVSLDKLMALSSAKFSVDRSYFNYVLKDNDKSLTYTITINKSSPTIPHEVSPQIVIRSLFRDNDLYKDYVYGVREIGYNVLSILPSTSGIEKFGIEKNSTDHIDETIIPTDLDQAEKEVVVTTEIPVDTISTMTRSPTESSASPRSSYLIICSGLSVVIIFNLFA